MPTPSLLVEATCLELRLAHLSGGGVTAVQHVPLSAPLAGRLAAGDWVAARALGKTPDGGGSLAAIGTEEGFLRAKEAVPRAQGEVFAARVVSAAWGEKRARLTTRFDGEAAAMVEAALRSADGPGRLFAASARILPEALARLGPEAAVLAQGAAAMQLLRTAITDLKDAAPAVNEWREAGLLFDAYGVTEALNEALSPVIERAGQARLVIENTEALTAIDIDLSGVSSAPAVWAPDAAREIVRQIRLRRLGGLVIVDCPAPGSKEAQAVLKAHLQDLPGEWTSRAAGGGLTVLTGPRLGPTLAEDQLDRGVTHRAIPSDPSGWAAATDLARRLAFSPDCRRARFDLAVAPRLHRWLEAEGGPAWRCLVAAHPLLGGRRIDDSLADAQFELSGDRSGR